MDETLEEMDVWVVCRICGVNNHDLISIYDENGFTLQLEEKINHYLPITVTQEDELPLVMCAPCIDKLNTIHELIVACLEADEKLKELLQLRKKYLELNAEKLPRFARSVELVDDNGLDFEEENKPLSSIQENELNMGSLSEFETCERVGLPLEARHFEYELSLPIKEERDIEKETGEVKNLAGEDKQTRAEEVEEDCKEDVKTVLLVNGDNEEETSKCKYCQQVCDDLESHLQSSKCKYCGVQFACPGSVKLHELQHQKQYYKCTFPGCKKRFQESKELERHSAIHALVRPYLCDLCGKSFIHGNNLRTHYRTHQQGPKEHKCELCGKAFRARFVLRNHMMSHTGERPFLCERCPKRFATREALKQHSAIHGNERPFRCSLCTFTCFRRGNLAKHYETHSDTKFECSVCHLAFPTRLQLQNHHYTHTDDELKSIKELEGPSMAVCTSFRCEECGKFLSSKASLIIHQRMHSGDRPYECSRCGKRFSQKPSLDYHFRLHTGERPHLCAFCGQGFNSKAAKDSHERVHTGEKPYRCNICTARFRNCANLRQHQLIHSDSREHPCSVCGKRFRRREAAQVHMRVHTGERPYTCPLCLKKFTQKGDQLKHTRAHVMKNDKKCTFCGQEFVNRRVLRQHRCELKVVNDNQHFETVLLNPTELIANTEITVVTANVPEHKD